MPCRLLLRLGRARLVPRGVLLPLGLGERDAVRGGDVFFGARRRERGGLQRVPGGIVLPRGRRSADAVCGGHVVGGRRRAERCCMRCVRGGGAGVGVPGGVD